MKKILIGLCVALMLMAGASVSHAVPFQVTGSSADVTWTSGGGLILYEGFSMDTPVELAQGDSTEFTFGQFNVPVSLGKGTLDLTINFLSPEFETEDNSVLGPQGSFKVMSLFSIVAGVLNFEDQVEANYTYAGIPGVMTLELYSMAGIDACWFDLKGKITNNADPIPEPATMLLMGAGLIGLVGVGRRKLTGK